MVKFEYLRITTTPLKKEMEESWLDAKGEKGWELVSVVPIQVHIFSYWKNEYYFKRKCN
jgi:hypothetical protein